MTSVTWQNPQIKQVSRWDYLRRCMDGTATEKVFKISLLGAKNIRTEKNGFNLNIPSLCRYI